MTTLGITGHTAEKNSSVDLKSVSQPKSVPRLTSERLPLGFTLVKTGLRSVTHPGSQHSTHF